MVDRRRSAALPGVVEHNHWICSPSLSATNDRAIILDGASARTEPASLPRSKAFSIMVTDSVKWPANHWCAG